jgi:hypothetical protein
MTGEKLGVLNGTAAVSLLMGVLESAMKLMKFSRWSIRPEASLGIFIVMKA